MLRPLMVFLFFCVLQLHIAASQAAPQTSQSSASLALVREKIDAIKDKSGIDEALRTRILNAYYAAEDNLEELQVVEQKTQDLQQMLKTLPVENKQLERRIAQEEKQSKEKKPENFSSYPTDELEQRLIIEKSNLNELKTTISSLELQQAELLKRPQQIREALADLKNIQNNTQQELATLSTLVINKQELDARQLQLDTRTRKLNTKVASLELENIVYPLMVEKQKRDLDLQNLHSEQLSALVKSIDDYLTERRQQEIDKAQAALILQEKEAADKPPVIREATKENIRFTQALQKSNKKLEYYSNLKSEIDNRYKQLEKDFKSAEQKIDLAGLSPALGNLLREQRRNLPVLKNYQGEMDKIQEDIAQSSLKLFQLDEVHKSLDDMDQAIYTRMEQGGGNNMSDSDKLKLRTELRVLLNDQKDLVLKLSSVYSAYSRTLADVDFSMHQLVNMGEQYGHYLDQRLLWVPSAPVINKQYLVDIFESLLWFADLSHWWQLVLDIQGCVSENPFLSLLGLIVVFLPLWFKSKIKNRLAELLKKSSKLYSDRFTYTFDGLAYAFLLALPFALLMSWLGWILLLNAKSSFSVSVANGLLAAAVPMLILQFFYHIFKPQGVVQSMFGWEDHSIHLLHSQIKWVRMAVLPGIFLVGLFAGENYSEHAYSLGRTALIFIMLALTYVLHRFAHPTNGLAKAYYEDYPGHWLTRLRYLWYIGLVLMPLSIIGFAIAGYYQSALELQQKLVILLRLAFFTTILHEVVMRWLVLANRQLALQNARQKRKQQELAHGGKDIEGGATVINEEEVLLDIPKINEQNRKLLFATISVILLVGSWLTLRDILPAFSIFENVVLWQHLAQVDGQESLQPITLINVFLCLFYLGLMMVFVNNFPGLVDLIFAGKYSMAAGSRYALVQLTRYAVVTLTLIAVANELGGSWSQVQWLVAALGVGLGFGLQEIFANLVSGIILLFERPIRVGDTVTVGDVSGKVCRIQMRATTIIDWDMKELVVPNKTFITERLINWTLTDTTTRIVIPVGIGYGCDEEVALKIFKQIFEETPLVLKDPEPSAFFIGFGESSLDFHLRVFVRDLGDRLPVTDDIHRRIRRAFKDHGIEIPFPQRDLHIRSSEVDFGRI